MALEDQNIPEMEINKYSIKDSQISENIEKAKEKAEKTKKEFEKLKAYVLKNYKFTQAIGILPPQAIPMFVEEGEVSKETEKYIHLFMIIPESQFKNIAKIKKEIVKETEKIKGDKIWLHIKTPVDVWEYCMDSKFEIVSAIAMSYPLYDKGILGALRVAEIHKSLVLKKFEKFVVTYVIAGSLVRGEEVKTSDVDVFVVINDTDVKRMPRLELRERLRAMIYKYIAEAEALAGVKNKLNVQIYLLTDFWESVKDAHPVIFTFIRDGVPIYDRGTFLPWKALLRMGKLKPSPEAIDVFMAMGEKAIKRAKKYLLDIVLQDIFPGVSSASQALLMLYGLPPPNIKETVKQMKHVFVDKEKMLEKKYIDILEEVMIKYYKGFEHGKVKEVSGQEIDRLLKSSKEYLERLKELRKQIEKRAQEKTIEQIYKDVFELLKSILGNKTEAKLVEEFEKKLVDMGKFQRKNIEILQSIVKAKKMNKRAKTDIHKADEIRKKSVGLINDLIEYTQRCDLAVLEKTKMGIKYKEKSKEKFAEILNCDGTTFLFKDNAVKKITNKIENADMQEVSRLIERQKLKKQVSIDPHVFDILKKELGKFEIVL